MGEPVVSLWCPRDEFNYAWRSQSGDLFDASRTYPCSGHVAQDPMPALIFSYPRQKRDIKSQRRCKDGNVTRRFRRRNASNRVLSGL